jgi:hypothetical protein
VAPVLHDLPVRDAEHVYGPDLNPLASRSDALELPPVGTAHRYAGCHLVPFGYQVLDSDSYVGEGFASLREGLLEGVDEFGRRIAGKAFVVESRSVDYLLRPIEVARLR